VPVTYTIDASGKTVRTKCAGEVTLEEVTDHFRALQQDPECPSYLDVLLDLSEMSSLPEGHEIREISHEIGGLRGRVQFGACAVVASSEAVFGMMRVFAVLTQEYFRVTHVFRLLAEAEAWLVAQQSQTGRTP